MGFSFLLSPQLLEMKRKTSFLPTCTVSDGIQEPAQQQQLALLPSFLPFPCVSAERAAVSSSRVRFDSVAPPTKTNKTIVDAIRASACLPNGFLCGIIRPEKDSPFFLKCAREKKKEPNLVQSPPLYSTAVRAWCFYLRLHFSSVRRSLFLFGGDWRLVRGASISLHHLGGWDGCVCMLAYIAPWRRLGENPSSGSVSADTFSRRRRRRNFSLLRWGARNWPSRNFCVTDRTA